MMVCGKKKKTPPPLTLAPPLAEATSTPPATLPSFPTLPYLIPLATFTPSFAAAPLSSSPLIYAGFSHDYSAKFRQISKTKVFNVKVMIGIDFEMSLNFIKVE